jgi:hypothetical protein
MPSYIVALVTLAISLSAPASFAACLDTDSAHPECRLPKGDAWCAKQTEHHSHAYRGECLEDAANIDLEGRAPFNWFALEDLDQGLRERIDMGSFDHPDQVGFALIRLGEETPADQSDALLVYRFHGAWCGSGGCDLRIYSTRPGQVSEPLISISAGGGPGPQGILQTGLTLGEHYHKGMRNLLINQSIIWSWNGKEYTIDPATQSTLTMAVPAADGYGANYRFSGGQAHTDLVPTALLTLEDPPGVTFLMSCYSKEDAKNMLILEIVANPFAPKTPAQLRPLKNPGLDDVLACRLCFQGDCKDTTLAVDDMSGNFTQQVSTGSPPDDARLEITLDCDAIRMTWTGRNMIPALCALGE